MTALCLHADIPHALGNALIATYLVGAVCRQFGAGVGIALILLSGAIGNALNAFAAAIAAPPEPTRKLLDEKPE